MKENPKQISYHIDSKIVELKASGDFIAESAREYLQTKRKQYQAIRLYGKTVPKKNIVTLQSK